MRAVRPRAAKRMQSASATSCPCIVCCSSPRRQQAPPRRQVEDRSSHAQLSLTGFGYHFWTCCGAAGEHTFEHTLTSPRQQAIAWRASEQQEALISLSITSGSPQQPGPGMGQGSSSGGRGNDAAAGVAEAERPDAAAASGAVQQAAGGSQGGKQGLKGLLPHGNRAAGISSIDSCSSTAGDAQLAQSPGAGGDDALHSSSAFARQQQQQQQLLDGARGSEQQHALQQLSSPPPHQQLLPYAPGPSSTTLKHSYSGSSTDSSSLTARGSQRRSGSMDQGSPMQRLSLGDGQAGGMSPAGGAPQQQQQQQHAGKPPPSQPGRRSSVQSQQAPQQPPQQQQKQLPQQRGRNSDGGLMPSGAAAYAGSIGSCGSMGSQDTSRASFSRDALLDDGHDGGAGSSRAPQSQPLEQDVLHKHNQQQQQQGGRPEGHRVAGGGRRSFDSGVSHASSIGAHSARSSFALDAAPAAEVDPYGRPSFAAFERADKVLAGRGAAFEAGLPPDLADMYRRLAVLLPAAPIPLLTMLQLWGVTDAAEARDNVQVFAMQGVLKVATLPDGATWLLVSPDHQQYLLAAHPQHLRGWHQAVLDIYATQVIAARYMAQQQQLADAAAAGDEAAAAAAAAAAGPVDREVKPSQYVNDGYIWLALTHHLLGAGQLNQVRSLLTDPAWLEVKLHCYGVAAVVDDFRAYLQQVGSDMLIKAVLQAFQMGLSCCMERSHLPMMAHQLVLRLMAAARAAAAAADAAAGATPRCSTSSQAAAASPSLQLAPRDATSLESAGSASLLAQQSLYQAEMALWWERQYAACCAAAQLLRSPEQQAAGQQQMQLVVQQMQAAAAQQAPPHLMAYTPSLRQAGGRHRMALRGHVGAIRHVLITPDGKDVLTASDDGGVQVWDMDIGDCVMQLRLADAAAVPGGPESAPAPLTALAVTPDGCCCLSGDADGWLCCWSLKSGQLVERVRAHKGRLNALVVDASGSRCMTGGQDRVSKLWSLPASIPSPNSGSSGGGAAAVAAAHGGGSGSGGGAAAFIGSLKCELTMAGHGLQHLGTGAVLDVALSSDGVLGVSASDDFSLKLWDLDQQTALKSCKGHAGWVVSVRFVGTSHTIVSASHDQTARVWDAWTGDSLAVLSGHSGRLNAVRSSADGRIIVTCSDDQTARVWETRDFSCIGVLSGHTSWLNDVALTRNGSQAVTTSGDGTARLWHTGSGRCLQVLQGHSDNVTAVVLTSRGRFAVTGSEDGTAQVWDLAAQDVSAIDMHDGKVIGVVACRDGSAAASIGADGCLRLWDLRSGTCTSNQAGHVMSVPQGLQLVSGGSRAFSAGGDRKLLAWDMRTGAPTVCLPRQQGSRAKCIAVSADGSTAAVLLFDSSMSVHETATGALRCHLMQRGDRDAQRVHSGGVNAVYLTADGSRAVSVSKDATARIWDTATAACLLVLQGHGDSVHAAALSADEALLATASFDCTVRLWDLRSGDCLKVLQHTDPVLRVAFSPACGASSGARNQAAPCGNACRLVTGCDGRALWLWDAASGACVAALGEHKEAVNAVAFSADGAWLASASADRSVLVWEAATGRLAGLYVGDAAMVCCCFARRDGGSGSGSGNGTGGLALLAGDASGHVHFLRL